MHRLCCYAPLWIVCIVCVTRTGTGTATVTIAAIVYVFELIMLLFQPKQKAYE